jgi:hypothetical protein
VELSGGWTWQDGSALLSAGTASHDAVFVPADTDNYNTLERQIQVTVEKAIGSGSVTQNDWIYGASREGPTLSSVSDNTDGVILTYTGRDGTSYPLSDTVPTESGKYTIIAAFPETANYLAFTASADFEIKKATPQDIIPPAPTGTYSPELTLSDIALPDGWAWEDPTIRLSAGTWSYYALFTPADQDNYVQGRAELTLTVNKAVPEYTVPELGAVIYSPSNTLSKIPLPEGWSWVDPDAVPAIGNNSYEAIFTPQNADDYETVAASILLAVKSNEPLYVVPEPSPVTYSPGLTLGDIPLPEGWSWGYPDTPLESGTNRHQAIYSPSGTGQGTVVATVTVTVNKGHASSLLQLSIDPPVATEHHTQGSELADWSLPKGWQWVDESMHAIPNSDNRVFYAYFDVTGYEKNYDLSKIEGYDPLTHRIVMSVEIDVDVYGDLDTEQSSNMFLWLFIVILPVVALAAIIYQRRRNHKEL